MGAIVGFIFWMFIAIKVGNAIGKGVGGEINVWSEKQYDKAEQRIAKKYDPIGYPRAHVWRHKVGDAKFEQYKAEVNALRKEWGKSEWL